VVFAPHPIGQATRNIEQTGNSAPEGSLLSGDGGSLLPSDPRPYVDQVFPPHPNGQASKNGEGSNGIFSYEGGVHTPNPQGQASKNTDQPGNNSTANSNTGDASRGGSDASQGTGSQTNSTVTGNKSPDSVGIFTQDHGASPPFSPIDSNSAASASGGTFDGRTGLDSGMTDSAVRDSGSGIFAEGNATPNNRGNILKSTTESKADLSGGIDPSRSFANASIPGANLGPSTAPSGVSGGIDPDSSGDLPAMSSGTVAFNPGSESGSSIAVDGKSSPESTLLAQDALFCTSDDNFDDGSGSLTWGDYTLGGVFAIAVVVPGVILTASSAEPGRSTGRFRARGWCWAKS